VAESRAKGLNLMQIIDADGHVNDRPCMDEISQYMPAGNRTQVFPAFDHIHFHFLEGGEKRSRTGTVGPKEWLNFLDEVGIDWTVVYPTAGLAVGRIIAEDWAIAACRAYNNWLYEKFTSVSPRIKGMALIPIQDADAACAELRRAMKELGMAGAMLPSNGEGIKGHFGSKIYWPIYAEAERLNAPLAIHVGALHHLGMDSIGVYYPVHALGHPFGIMAQAAAMLSYGVFDRFPKLRVGFLEGGATWVPFFMDRLDRSYPHHLQVDINGDSCLARNPMSWRANIFVGT
jgi:predicted TIM-barrel fold metal-dependent hydrolase